MSRRDFVKFSSAVSLASIVSIVVPRPATALSLLGDHDRSIVLGTILAGSTYYYFPFIEGPITDADLSGITQITYAWTGDSSPAPGVQSKLASGNNPNGSPWANGPELLFTTSPYVVTDSTTWTGNRPYRGMTFLNNITGKDWAAGKLFIWLG